MRRSRQVVAPLLAAAALTSLTGPPAAAQTPQPSTWTEARHEFTTLREGFGSSFHEHPLAWFAGAAWGALILSRAGG